jgi:hypothetical protein
MSTEVQNTTSSQHDAKLLVICRFIADVAKKHGKAIGSIALQMSDEGIEVFEVTDDGYHNWLEHLETVQTGI